MSSAKVYPPLRLGNPHPVDEFVRIRRERDKLDKKLDTLREKILSGEFGYVGDQYALVKQCFKHRHASVADLETGLGVAGASAFIVISERVSLRDAPHPRDRKKPGAAAHKARATPYTPLRWPYGPKPRAKRAARGVFD